MEGTSEGGMTIIINVLAVVYMAKRLNSSRTGMDILPAARGGREVRKRL